MPVISKSRLKATMLQVFREIEATGEELIVTHNRRPVLRVLPIAHRKTVDEIFAGMRGKVVYHEDINTPTTDEWDQV